MDPATSCRMTTDGVQDDKGGSAEVTALGSHGSCNFVQDDYGWSAEVTAVGSHGPSQASVQDDKGGSAG